MKVISMDIPNGEGLTKDCCAFANSKGGFIGIRTKDKRTEIVRNESSSELRNRFGQKIIATPNIYFGLPNVQNIPNSEK
jgi:predicted HTH transcriptional regulator